MRHIEFPSIEQFRTVIKEVKYLRPEGVRLNFNGTVKMHGSNAGVSLARSTAGVNIYAQSRNNIITPEKDNAGFAAFFQANEAKITSLLLDVETEYKEMLWDAFHDGYVLTLFGEWCGGSVQKGVALAQLEKMFVVFALSASPLEQPYSEKGEKNIGQIWLDSDPYKIPEIRIFNTVDFPTYDLEIDFNQPELVQNQLIEITNQVEAECPVGKYFGVSGVGEGVVWTSRLGGRTLRFKVKGEKHSVSKVKTLAAVDVEKVESMNAFIAYAVTEARMKQAVQEVFGAEEPSKQKMGEFIRWLNNDVVKEESDTMAASGIDPKDIGKPLSSVARQWFLNNY